MEQSRTMQADGSIKTVCTQGHRRTVKPIFAVFDGKGGVKEALYRFGKDSCLSCHEVFTAPITR